MQPMPSAETEAEHDSASVESPSPRRAVGLVIPLQDHETLEDSCFASQGGSLDFS